MTTTHEVVGGAVVLRTLAGSGQYLYRGAGFDASAFTEASVAHASSLGLIAEAAAVAETSESDETAEAPVKSWNHDRIDAWAAEQEPPIVFVPNEDASKPLTKEQKLEQIAAAVAERSNQQ